ncbi:MAG: hypothetical protein HZA50_06670 [Planctomycetes bacterium]|nr:hypothetical protein [Planctomycetota bacterium]
MKNGRLVGRVACFSAMMLLACGAFSCSQDQGQNAGSQRQGGQPRQAANQDQGQPQAQAPNPPNAQRNLTPPQVQQAIGQPGGQQGQRPAGPPTGPEAKIDEDFKIREFSFLVPATHENLQIVFIMGANVLGGDFLSLQEALEAKALVIHETGNVNQLTLENVSDKNIFIQSGDIIRGGKQDRTCPNDLVILPHSGKIPLASFCVESGRWSGRKGNSPDKFDASNNMLLNNSQKIAARVNKGQSEVWREVEASQAKLEKAAGQSVKAAESPSSLELTMDNEKVKKSIDAYTEKLSKLPADKGNIVGFATVINGKIQTIDVYGSSALFAKLWPKLLKSASVEAFANVKKDEKFAAVIPDDVRKFMLDARAAKMHNRDTKVDAVNNEYYYESDKVHYLRSTASTQPAGPNATASETSQVMHDQYIAK